MATKGMSVYTHQGEDYTINDPNIADEFSASAAYQVGDYVNYQGNLYRFTAAHAAGAWSSSDTTQVKIGAEIKSKGEEIEDINEQIEDVQDDYNQKIEQILMDGSDPETYLQTGLYNVTTHEIVTPVTSARYIELNASAGDLILAFGYVYGASFPLWVAFDSSNNVVGSSMVHDEIAKELFIAPAGTTKIIVNCNVNNTAKVYSSDRLMSKADVQETIAPVIEMLKTAADSEGTIEPGVYNIATGEIVSPLTSTRHIEIPVNPNEVYFVAGYFYNANFPLWVLLNQGGEVVKSSDWNTSGAGKETIIVPDNAVKLIVNCSTNTTENYAKTIKGVASNNNVNTFNGKKMVWLGTSIPAGAKYGLNNMKSYPMIIGNKLGATVVNEAVGESSVHCKKLQRIDPTYNPYGFVANWEKCARCLTNSTTEVNWLIDHFNDTDGDGNYIFTENRPESLTDDDKAFYRSCSYMVKLKSHLDDGDVDVWVFDHGHNDNQYDDNVVNGETLTDDEVAAEYGVNNLYTWEGGCNFIFSYILNNDNKAKILMIGEYDNRLATVGPHQLKVAESWEFPFYKQWEVIGWNVNHKITTTGYWNNNTGLWVESGGTEQEITIHDRFVRDHIHPSSDASGYATEHIAQLMAKWLVNNSLVY